MAYDDNYQQSPDEARKDVQGYVSLHDYAIPLFQSNWDEAFENARLWRTEHFSPEERAYIEGDDRIPYSIPVVEPRINNMISQQMLARSEWRILGASKEDEIGAEVLTQILKNIDMQNHFQDIESDIYADGMVKKVGIVKRCYENTKDGLGKNIKLRRKQFNQVMWDLNCKEYEVPVRASWMQEWDFHTKEQLYAEYPDKIEMIKSAGDSAVYTDVATTDKKYYNWSLAWYVKDKLNKLVKLVCHYQRKYETVYVNYYQDPNTGMVTPQESAEPLSEEKTEVSEPAQEGQPTESQQSLAEGSYVREYIVCTEFIKDMPEPLRQYKIDSNIMPLHPFFPKFDDGFYWGIYDQIKWAQVWIDRMSIQIDFSIGTLLKNSYEMEWSRLHEDDKARWIQLDDNGKNIGLSSRATKGGAVFRRIGASRIIDVIPNQPIPPDLFKVWEYMMRVVELNLGGKNPLGLKETANESGVAVEHRLEAALQSAYIFIDNLRRWKRTVGEGLVEMVKEVYTEEKVFRILGSEMSPRILKLLQSSGVAEPAQGDGNTFFMKYIPQADLEYDLIVDKAEYSPTGKQKKFLMMQTYNNLRVQSGKPPLPFKIIGKYMPDMDMTIYDEIVDFENMEEQQAQQANELQKQQMLFKGNLEQAKETREGLKVMTEQANNLNGQQ